MRVMNIGLPVLLVQEILTVSPGFNTILPPASRLTGEPSIAVISTRTRGGPGRVSPARRFQRQSASNLFSRDAASTVDPNDPEPPLARWKKYLSLLSLHQTSLVSLHQPSLTSKLPSDTPDCVTKANPETASDRAFALSGAKSDWMSTFSGSPSKWVVV